MKDTEEGSNLWKEGLEDFKDALLSVKTPGDETKEICQPSPDSSNSPQQTVDQNSPVEAYQRDVKGMFI